MAWSYGRVLRISEEGQQVQGVIYGTFKDPLPDPASKLLIGENTLWNATYGNESGNVRNCWLQYFSRNFENRELGSSTSPTRTFTTRFPHKNTSNTLYFDGYVGQRKLSECPNRHYWIEE